jgi:hypothetical protein
MAFSDGIFGIVICFQFFSTLNSSSKLELENKILKNRKNTGMPENTTVPIWGAFRFRKSYPIILDQNDLAHYSILEKYLAI